MQRKYWAFLMLSGFFQLCDEGCSTAQFYEFFNEEGLGIDASSIHEVERAVRAGFGTESISLSTQELSDDFIYWAQDGIQINLCSINQILNLKWGKNKKCGLTL